MRNLLFSLLHACIVAAAPMQAMALDGQVDSGFGTAAEYPGFGFYTNPNGNTNNDNASKVLAAADGSLYLIGRIAAQGGARLSIERTDAGGYPDYDFGEAGLRSYVRPCSGAYPWDAAFDSQGRLLMVVGGCADFIIYRFLPNGDPDVTFDGSGVASVAFDRGGSNEDSIRRLLVLPDDGLIVTGWVSTPTNTHLGVARLDSSGQPVDSFGIGGQVVVPFELDTFFVNGVHRMDDGRLMIAGTIADNTVRKHFAVRLLENGALDIGYGNTSAGVSTRDFKIALNLVESAIANASWMERDGSLIQVGAARYATSPNSGSDVLVVRWRADGQLDVTLGPSGARRFALDFAGPNPVDPANNSDSGRSITRVGNGRYVILATSYGSDGSYGVGMLRLARDLSLDASFGNAGTIRHTVNISSGTPGIEPTSLLLRSGGLVVSGNVNTNGINRMHGMLGMQHDVLFANDFD